MIEYRAARGEARRDQGRYSEMDGRRDRLSDPGDPRRAGFAGALFREVRKASTRPAVTTAQLVEPTVDRATICHDRAPPPLRASSRPCRKDRLRPRTVSRARCARARPRSGRRKPGPSASVESNWRQNDGGCSPPSIPREAPRRRDRGRDRRRAIPSSRNERGLAAVREALSHLCASRRIRCDARALRNRRAASP